MEIKGTAVKSINAFVQDNFKDRYSEWFSSLSTESQEIYNTALTNGWYSVKYGVEEPTIRIAEMFYDGDIKKGAWESGMYSAFIALHGVYKIYVRFSSPGHVVDRGSRILPAYYNPITITQLVREKNFVKFQMIDCDGVNEIIEQRIAGWMYKALEISGCTTMSVEVVESIKTHNRTIIDAKWE